MTEDRAAAIPAQLRRPRPWVVVTGLFVLLSTPSLVVGGFLLVTDAQFARFEAERGATVMAGSRYDAYKHAYASGVVAVLLGDRIAQAAGGLVELWEQDPCLEREKDYINNREGRRLALATDAEDPAHWRARFAEALYEALRRRDPAFSVNRGTDGRVAAACDQTSS